MDAHDICLFEVGLYVREPLNSIFKHSAVHRYMRTLGKLEAFGTLCSDVVNVKL